jgi:eukaryotic-like serine/threonine-protein kinase
MSLSPGDRIGRFEILGCLGIGGMGEVYRARDPQLQREVAIKVLPAAFSRDPDRQRRFEHEARAAGSLNHPNIVAVHDIGVLDGGTWIVTELLIGETLRQRLDGRPLSARTAIDYAIQIASGLAAAHERGLAHLDIKPANLFVTRDGRIKVLDFGIAKLIGPDAPSDDTGDATEPVTIDSASRMTVVGTAAYMSPEQARGLRTDHRSDIFSFGTVLYEMLAGFTPFRRGAPAETLRAIVNDEVPDFAAAAAVHPTLEQVVRHCLEKAPEARFQNARDLVFTLESISHTMGSTPASALAARDAALRNTLRNTSRSTLRNTLRNTPARMAVGLLVVSTVAALGYLAWTRQASTAATRAVHSVRRVTDFIGLEEWPAVSPDRKSLAFTASVQGRRQIFVRLLASGSPLQITSDPIDHQFPRWSPDAGSLLYFSPAEPGDAQGAIWSIPALGGAPRRIMGSIGGADVSSDGRVTCFSLVNGQIHLLTSALDGSDVRAVARFDAGYHRYPRWSPDRQWIAYQRGDGVRDDVFVVSARGGEPRQLTHERNVMSGVAWRPDSTSLVYGSSRGSTVPYLPPLRLWEVGLDGRAPRAITPAEVSYEQPDVHDTGLLAAARTRMRFDIWKFPFGRVATDNVREGVTVTSQTGHVLTPAASPDGDEIAFLSDSGGHSNLWVRAMQSGTLRQITFEDDPAVSVGAPVWSPNRDAIAFVSSKRLTGLEFGVWLVNRDGSNLRNIAMPGLGMAWSPDGKWLYYADTSAGALKKVETSRGTPPVTVRSEPTRNVIGLSGETLYYTVERPLVDGRPEFDIRAATPESGPSRLLARIPASRVPAWQIVNPSLSPDGEWLAVPLTDGFTTNIWALSTRNGEWRQVTDFGARAIFIARRVSWSPDGRSIFAAIGEGDSDVVLLDGLFERRLSDYPN